MAAPLILRIITDARQALKTNETVIASNTAVGRSAVNMGKDYELSARAQIAANVAQIESAQAQLAAVKTLGAQMKAEGTDRIAINRAIEASQLKLDAAMGLSAGRIGKTGTAAKEAERDLGKLTRGAIAGSGAAASLGRSLAFASTGFIAVAGGATLIADSIRKAEELESAQRKADRQLQTSGKTWEEFGGQIDSVLLKEGHLAGFTRTELLGSFTFLLRVGGNVSNSLNLVAEAADIARGRGISLQAASIALSKALGGSATALRRLGIIVPNNVSKMAALNYVQAKFAGQAKAGTTASERLSATFSDIEAEIGKALLPTFERLAERFSKWLHQIQESGRLQKDLHELGRIFGVAGDAIRAVDDATGGFANTLKFLLAIKLTSWAGAAITSLTKMAASWGAVETAASGAAAAETEAAAAAGGIPAAALAATAVGGFLAYQDIIKHIHGGSRSNEFMALQNVGGGQSVFEQKGQFYSTRGNRADVGQSVPITRAQAIAMGADTAKAFVTGFDAVITPRLRSGKFGSGFFPAPFGGQSRQQQGMASAYGRAPRTSYETPLYLQIAQAQADLTASTKDNVAVARRIIKNIKRIIDRGNYTQKGLLDLLQTEAAALGIIQQAQDAAKAKAAARKAAALAARSTFEVPGYLQLAQAKAEAYGKDQTSILKKIIAAAEAAIRSGKKNWKGLLAAYQAIGAARAALAQQAQDQLIPLKLQLALARTQALGGDQTRILLKMRAALYRALRKAKGNIQRQIDIWNQIAQINSEMGNSITNAYGMYKKASLKAETEGLGLTAAQRRLLEARLSQRGPGGTVPAEGTGAAGYVIDPETGRPVRHRRHHHAGSSNNLPASSGGGGGAFTLKQTIKLDVHLDKKVIARVVTRQQQTYRSQNPSSRRGPHAATATA